MGEIVISSKFLESVQQMNNKSANYALLEKFIERYSDNGVLTKTGVAYQRELNNLLEYLDYKRIDQVDYFTLNEYCNMVKSNYKSVATQTRIITTIRSFFSFLSKVGAVRANVAGLITLPKSKDNGESAVERVLNEKEIESFFKVVRDSGNIRDYTACSILLATGIRIEELCTISWKDIIEDMYGNVGVNVLGKGGKVRLVKLRNDVWKRVREYREYVGLSASINPNDETALILNKEGNRLTDRYIRKVIAKYAKRAGIDKPVSPHWFRHTSATFALMGGANVEDVRKQLGHSSLQHTTRYLHNVQGLKETATDHIKVAF